MEQSLNKSRGQSAARIHSSRQLGWEVRPVVGQRVTIGGQIRLNKGNRSIVKSLQMTLVDQWGATGSELKPAVKHWRSQTAVRAVGGVVDIKITVWRRYRSVTLILQAGGRQSEGFLKVPTWSKHSPVITTNKTVLRIWIIRAVYFSTHSQAAILGGLLCYSYQHKLAQRTRKTFDYVKITSSGSLKWIKGQIWNKRQEKVLVPCCNSNCSEMNLLCRQGESSHMQGQKGWSVQGWWHCCWACYRVCRSSRFRSSLSTAASGCKHKICTDRHSVMHMNPTATELPLWFRTPWARPSAPAALESTRSSCLCCTTADVLLWRHSEDLTGIAHL